MGVFIVNFTRLVCFYHMCMGEFEGCACEQVGGLLPVDFPVFFNMDDDDLFLLVDCSYHDWGVIESVLVDWFDGGWFWDCGCVRLRVTADFLEFLDSQL